MVFIFFGWVLIVCCTLGYCCSCAILSNSKKTCDDLQFHLQVEQVKLRETTLDLDLTQNYVKVAQRLRYIFERCTLQGGREHKKLRHNIWDD